MGKIKKIFATLLAIAMIGSLGTSVFAGDGVTKIVPKAGITYTAVKTVYDDESLNNTEVEKTATKRVYDNPDSDAVKNAKDSSSERQIEYYAQNIQPRYVPCIGGDHRFESGTDYVCHALSNNTCQFTSQRFTKCVNCGYYSFVGPEATIEYHATGSSGCLFNY